MSRMALVTCLLLSACFGVGGKFVKDLTNTHVMDTGLRASEMSVIDRGATRHGCTYVDRSNLTTVCEDKNDPSTCVTAVNYACPELPSENPIGCRPEGSVIRCACTGDEGTCKTLIAAVVQEGRAP